MATGEKIYHRTEAGEQALLDPGVRLAAEDRALLESIREATRLNPREPRVLRALARLESAGLVEAVALDWLEELYRLGAYEPSALRRRTKSPSSS